MSLPFLNLFICFNETVICDKIHDILENIEIENSYTTYEFKFIQSNKIFDIKIITNYPSYILLQKIRSLYQYEIWTEQYLEEYRKKYLPEYYETNKILIDIISDIRNGTYKNIFCTIDLYRTIKKTNIEKSTTELFLRLFTFLNGNHPFLWTFYISKYILYSSFQKKMLDIITYLHSKGNFKKANGIHFALCNLSKIKLNKYIDKSILMICNNIINIKKNNIDYLFLCLIKIFNEKCYQIPFRIIYSYL